MNRLRLILGISAAAGLVVAFLAGRYTAKPAEKVSERLVVDADAVTKALIQARAEWKKDVTDHTRVVTKYQQGKPVERVVYVDRDTSSGGSSTATTHGTTTEQTHAESVRVTEPAAPSRWGFALSAGWDPLRLGAKPDVTADVSYRLLGPLALYGMATARESSIAVRPETTFGVRLVFP